jgi:osmoprotectant transport system ATP-binding protein
MPAVEFMQVSFGRDLGTRVLDDHSLTVDAGEVLVLVGASGAGKTTALKLVNRLLLPDTGSVKVQGRDTREWDPIRLRRGVGYVIQEVGLFPHLSVADNIAVVPRLERWPDDRVASRVHELLELTGLAPGTFAARWPDELSGGQRQRVGVARALAIDPPVLLLDEPFGALDPLTRRQLQRQFRLVQSRLHKAVILVTHDLSEAMTLGDRIAVVQDGRVAWCGAPEEIADSDVPYVRELVATVTPFMRARPGPASG